MAQRIEKSRYPEKTPELYRLEEEELADNGSRRAPIIVCVDCSFSMRQEHRLERVVEGLESFCRDMLLCPSCFQRVFVQVTCSECGTIYRDRVDSVEHMRRMGRPLLCPKCRSLRRP